jgi:hypothetical protein
MDKNGETTRPKAGCRKNLSQLLIVIAIISAAIIPWALALWAAFATH